MGQKSGKVVRLVRAKGFGFVKDDVTGREYFLHRSDTQDFDSLKEQDTVTFDVNPDSPKGPRAMNIAASAS
jgi:cold shock protein